MYLLATAVCLLALQQVPDEVAESYRAGELAEGDAKLERAAQALEASPSDESIDALLTLGQVAEEHWRYELALSLNKRALALVDRAEPRRSRAQVRALTNLARLQRIRNDSPAAKAAATRALRLHEQLHLPPDAAQSELLAVLAFTTALEQDYAAGEVIARRGVEVADATRDPATMASARNNLAAFLRWRHSEIEAERHYRDAIRLHRRAHLERSAGMAAAAHNLVQVLLERGRITQELADLEQEAADAAETSLGLRHPFTAETLDTLSTIYRASKRGLRSVEAADKARRSRGLAAQLCVNAGGTDGCLRQCERLELDDAGVHHVDAGFPVGTEPVHLAAPWQFARDQERAWASAHTLVDAGDGWAFLGADGGTLTQVYRCPEHFECVSLSEREGPALASESACFPRCPRVGSGDGCPLGQVCSELRRDGQALPGGVCAPR